MIPHNPLLDHMCGLLGSSRARRAMRRIGMGRSAPPPVPPARSKKFVVRDKGGISCEGAKYVLAAGRGLAVSVWVTHAETGSFQVIQNGSLIPLMDRFTFAPHFRRGSEITLTAEGPDAGLALKWARELLEAHPQERGSIYRELRATRAKGART